MDFDAYGAGKARTLSGYKLLFDPTDNGFCAARCLKYMGANPMEKAWMST